MNFGFFHFPGGNYIHYWDSYHYFMGGKYFKELGYYDLYKATYLAGREKLNVFGDVKNILDQKTYDVEEIAPESYDVVKKKFTTARWEEFKNDFAYFYPKDGRWSQLFLDHGYNAPPTRTALLLPLLNVMPLNDISLSLLVSIDYILILLTFFLVVKAFGKDVGLVAFIFFCTNVLARFNFIGGSIFRWDWICAAVVAASCIKLKKPWWAGLALAYAILARIFPIFFLFALMLQTLAAWSKKEPITLQVKLLASCALSGILLMALTFLFIDQPHYYQEFNDKIQPHNNYPFVNHIGVRVVDYYGGETSSSDMGTGAFPFETWKVKAMSKDFLLTLFIQCAFVGIIGFLLLQSDELTAFQYGAVFIFLFSTIANYYYSFLVVFFLPGLQKGKLHVVDAIKMVMLLGIMIVGYVLEHYTSFWLQEFFIVSCMLLAFFVITFVLEYLRQQHPKLRETVLEIPT